MEHNDSEQDRRLAASMLDRILGRAADRLGDLRPAVMERFYAEFPETRALFEDQSAGHREHLEGEMVAQTLFCVMTWLESPREVTIILQSTVPHHEAALDVPTGLFQGFIDAVIAVVRETVPAEAAAEHELLESIRAALHREALEAARLFGPGAVWASA